MKTLPQITIGEYAIDLTVEEKGHDLFFTAKCGEDYLQNRMVMNGEHTYTVEQFEKDIADHTDRLARELAGKLQCAKLRAGFLAEP